MLKSAMVALVLLLHNPPTHAAEPTPSLLEYSGIAFSLAQARGDSIVVIVSDSDACSVCDEQQDALLDALSALGISQLHTFVADIETDTKFSQAYKVTQPATIILFADGAEVGRVVGVSDFVSLCGQLLSRLLT
jgi:hypothetical protein